MEPVWLLSLQIENVKWFWGFVQGKGWLKQLLCMFWEIGVMPNWQRVKLKLKGFGIRQGPKSTPISAKKKSTSVDILERTWINIKCPLLCKASKHFLNLHDNNILRNEELFVPMWAAGSASQGLAGSLAQSTCQRRLLPSERLASVIC